MKSSSLYIMITGGTLLALTAVFSLVGIWGGDDRWYGTAFLFGLIALVPGGVLFFRWLDEKM